jgi:NACHT domain
VQWPYDKRVDPIHAWGAITAGIAITGALYAARALNPHTARSWGWPTNWMIIPVIVTGVGLILLFLPVRQSRRKGAPRRLISRFDRDYRAFVLAGLRFIDQKGLATVGPFAPELDDVYVDVSLVPRSPHLVKEGLLPDLSTVPTERLALNEFLDRPDPVVLAVIGAPGSGKTTLLRHTARQVFQRRDRQGRERRLPILLYLRDHSAAIVADPNITLTDLLRTTLGELRATEPDGWFEQRLRAGECVVLLDGLDEVAQSERRRKVAAWAERQIRQYPDNHYVITSRPHGYRAAEISGADVLQVRGFTAEQVSRFVHGWYRAVERYSTGMAEEDITARARREADDLLQRLDHTPNLHDLTANPLLLTMIANVHRYRAALPVSRAELYAEIIQVMLFRRQEAKDLPIQVAGEKKEALLRGVAYAMMQRRLSDLPQDEVLAEVRPALRRLASQITAEDFLADIGSNGLLVERETGLYCFAHHTFQEYLAAAYIHDKGLVDVLANAVDDQWWRETTLLYAARTDADRIVAACLNSGKIPALALAFDCADQGSEFAEDLRDRLEGLLADVSSPTTTQERRHLVTGVLLTRHLQQRIRTSVGTRICIRPITASLYQLFRDDTRTPAPDSLPPPIVGTEPISGVRASDAAALVGWVNTVIGGEAAYRLPSRAALEDPVAQRLMTSTTVDLPHNIWIEQVRSAPELWVPPGARHPHQVDVTTLTAHVDSDMTRSDLMLTRLLLMRSAIAVSLYTSYLASAIEHDHDLLPAARAFNLVLQDNLARAFARALERAQERDLTHALNLDPGLDIPLGLALDLSHVLGLARDLARDLDQARTLGIDRDLDVSRALDLSRALALALHRDREHQCPLDVDVDVDPDPDLDRDLNLADNLGRIRGDPALPPSRLLNLALGIRCSRVMGSALSQALTEALRGKPASNWPIEFSKVFAHVVGLSGNNYLVSPDTLAQRLTHATQTLAATQSSQGSTSESSWAAIVSRRLQQAAFPVFNRQEQLTRDAATSIRLAALCLAVEADALHHSGLGEDFRKIAAGITLLERRANGDDLATETIILASE